MKRYFRKRTAKVKEQVTFWIIDLAVARAIAQEDRKNKRAAA